MSTQKPSSSRPARDNTKPGAGKPHSQQPNQGQQQQSGGAQQQGHGSDQQHGSSRK